MKNHDVCGEIIHFPLHLLSILHDEYIAASVFFTILCLEYKIPNSQDYNAYLMQVKSMYVKISLV